VGGSPTCFWSAAMHVVSMILIGFVALEHLGFMVLETFLWTAPIGRKVFRNSAEVAEQSAVLAANQGIYNALLAVGLIVALFLPPDARRVLATYILAFIVLAGLYGGYTVSARIVLVQAVPAALALGALWAQG
jgi:putative membrane protein